MARTSPTASKPQAAPASSGAATGTGREIVSTVTVGGSPAPTGAGRRGSGGGGLGSHLPAARATLTAGARDEYVAGSPVNAYVNYARSLPGYIDDITRDLGLDVYRKMLWDDAVASAIGTLQSAVLEDGVHFTSAVVQKDDPAFAQAATYTADAERMLADLETPLGAVLWDMTRAFAYGHRVAEQVYALDTSPVTKKRQLTLRALKVKPARATAFVVDPFNNVLGLLGVIPGVGLPVQQGGLLLDTLKDTANLIPREKFAILTIRPEDNDPRGTSLLRPAYPAFYDKVSLAPEFIKFLSSFGTPSIVAHTAEGAGLQYATDAATGQPITTLDPVTGLPVPLLRDPIHELTVALTTLRNNSILALPFGADARVIESAADGSTYLEAFDRLDRRITQAILYNTLSSLEGKHQTRAASGTHENRFETLVKQLKEFVTDMIRRDILRRYLILNYGAEAARLTPLVSLGAPAKEDKTERGKMYVAAGYRVGRSQLAGIDEDLGAPERDPDEDPIPVGETVLVKGDEGAVKPQGQRDDESDDATGDTTDDAGSDGGDNGGTAQPVKGKRAAKSKAGVGTGGSNG